MKIQDSRPKRKHTEEEQTYLKKYLKTDFKTGLTLNCHSSSAVNIKKPTSNKSLKVKKTALTNEEKTGFSSKTGKKGCKLSQMWFLFVKFSIDFHIRE